MDIFFWSNFITRRKKYHSSILTPIVIAIISDIVIQILGIGKCEWTEQRRLFHAEEIYLKTEIKISQPTSGNFFKEFLEIEPFLM